MLCHQYDYVEISCMYKFPIELTLRNGERLKGTAYDTHVNDNQKECLKLKTGDFEKIIVMDEIIKMEVLVENSHFQIVKFD